MITKPVCPDRTGAGWKTSAYLQSNTPKQANNEQFKSYSMRHNINLRFNYSYKQDSRCLVYTKKVFHTMLNFFCQIQPKQL